MKIFAVLKTCLMGEFTCKSCQREEEFKSTGLSIKIFDSDKLKQEKQLNVRPNI